MASTIVTVPLVNANTDLFPVLNVANGIVPDEALCITCNLQFSPTAQAILIDLTESARKFSTIPIQGAFVDMSGSAIDMRLENPASGQSILAKASLQGYYNLLSPMPQRFIAVLSSAPAAALNITVIFYNTVIESEVWGLTSGPAGPTGAQGPPGATGATGPAGPAGPAGVISTVENQGTVVSPARAILNFTGAGVTATDDSVNTRTNITIPGYTLPAATATVLGGVKTGSNVAIAADGTISVPPTAALQTPWLSNINGAGFNLNTPGQINNATSLGLGIASNPNTPLMISSAANAAVESITSTNPAAGGITVWTNDTSISMAAGVGGSARGATQERNTGFFNVYPTGDMLFETQSTEKMRLTQAGNLWLGLGGITPASTGRLAVRTGTNQVFGVWGPVSGPGGVTLQSSNDAGSAYQPMQIETSELLLNVNGGDVGIGTSAPVDALTVHGAVRTLGQFTANLPSSMAMDFTPGFGRLVLWSADTVSYPVLQILLQNSNGSANILPVVVSYVGMGLGGINPAYQLHLANDSAAKPTTNTWTISSGAKVKRHVKKLRGGLDIINKLNPTEAEYNGKGGTPEGQRVVSLIAEEVREILPHTVTEDKDGNLGFNVHEVIHHLILAVQQLSQQLANMKPKAV